MAGDEDVEEPAEREAGGLPRRSVKQEALAGSGGTENERVAHVAGEEVVGKGAVPGGVEEGQRRPAKVGEMSLGRSEAQREEHGRR